MMLSPHKQMATIKSVRIYTVERPIAVVITLLDRRLREPTVEMINGAREELVRRNARL